MRNGGDSEKRGDLSQKKMGDSETRFGEKGGRGREEGRGGILAQPLLFCLFVYSVMCVRWGGQCTD